MDNGKHAFGGFRKLEADQNDICWIIILNNNLSSVQVSEFYIYMCTHQVQVEIM